MATVLLLCLSVASTSVQHLFSICSTAQACTNSQICLARRHFWGLLPALSSPHVGPSLPVLNPYWPPHRPSLLHLGPFCLIPCPHFCSFALRSRRHLSNISSASAQQHAPARIPKSAWQSHIFGTPSGPFLAPCWPIFAYLVSILGPSWPIFAPSWSFLPPTMATMFCSFALRSRRHLSNISSASAQRHELA